MTGPDDAGARAVLASSSELMREHRVEEGTKLLEEAIKSFPDDPHLRLRAAALALMAQDIEQAKLRVRQAVELAPDDPGVLTHAASHMEAMHEHEAAERWVRTAASLVPDDFELAGHLSHLMSKVLLRHGHADRAEAMARKAFEADPAMPEHGVMFAALLEGRGDVGEARAVIEQSLEHVPGNPNLQFALERLPRGRS